MVIFMISRYLLAQTLKVFIIMIDEVIYDLIAKL